MAQFRGAAPWSSGWAAGTQPQQFAPRWSASAGAGNDGRMKGSMPVEAPRSPISGWDELCNIRTDESKRQRPARSWRGQRKGGQESEAVLGQI